MRNCLHCKFAKFASYSLEPNSHGKLTYCVTCSYKMKYINGFQDKDIKCKYLLYTPKLPYEAPYIEVCYRSAGARYKYFLSLLNSLRVQLDLNFD